MPIVCNETTREFHLMTRSASYICCLLRNEQLGHLYYGKRITHRDSFNELWPYEFRPGLACVYEGDETYSLDLMKQEYPSYGTTDFREPAVQILQEDGSRITNFEYVGHTIVKGKPKLQGLPATYVEREEEVTSLRIILYDKLLDLELELLYSVYEELDAIVRSVKLKNLGPHRLNITRVMSVNVDFFDSDYELLHLSGAWARERHVRTRRLEQGIQSIGSTRGTSSNQHNPFLALKRKETTEFQGEVYGFHLVYSGNFLAQVEVDHYDVARVMLGINPFDFNWLLEPGEQFQAPEAVLVYSDQGLNGMSQIFHKLYQSRLVRGSWRDRERPVLINNWEATYFDFTEDQIISIASQAKELGVELFVLDDGWFGQRDDDKSSLGDWFANKRKLPNGIEGLARQITELGIRFGLWFEPEMVCKVSELYTKHPDWIIHVPNRSQSHCRNQYVLDLSRQEVVDYLYESMSAILSSAPISYVKWDMNRYMTEIGSAQLSSERQREVPHRYILGVYQLYERLIHTFPEVLFESCASGGARFDPGMLYYAPQVWTSDNTDAIERLAIQYGTSIAYPLSTMGAHVSAVPNHQVGRITSLATRASVAYFGIFGYELDVSKMTDREKETVRQQIAFYKEHRRLLQFGTFIRIYSPFDGDGNRTGWIVVSDDKKEAIAGCYHKLAKPHPGFSRYIFKGLDEKLEYRIEGLSRTYFGDELMHAGLYLTQQNPIHTGEETESRDFAAQVWRLQAVHP